MRRVIDNDFELTGPIARGDWKTVEAHLEAIRELAPDLGAYLVLARATAEVDRSMSFVRTRWTQGAER